MKQNLVISYRIDTGKLPSYYKHVTANMNLGLAKNQRASTKLI